MRKACCARSSVGQQQAATSHVPGVQEQSRPMDIYAEELTEHGESEKGVTAHIGPPSCYDLHSLHYFGTLFPLRVN